MTKPTKKLSPARNGAVYPTLKDVGLDRRFLLAGAAALAVGLNACGANTMGDMVVPDPIDASVEITGPDSSGGIWAADAGLVPPADGGEDPDGGGQGGLP